MLAGCVLVGGCLLAIILGSPGQADSAYLKIADEFDNAADAIASGTTRRDLDSRHKRIGKVWPMPGKDFDQMLKKVADGEPSSDAQDDVDRQVAIGQLQLYLAKEEPKASANGKIIAALRRCAANIRAYPHRSAY